MTPVSYQFNDKNRNEYDDWRGGNDNHDDGNVDGNGDPYAYDDGDEDYDGYTTKYDDVDGDVCDMMNMMKENFPYLRCKDITSNFCARITI